jgi:predicted PurR-regulated permease PerM
MARAEPSARTILRIIALVVLTAVALYLVYLLRRPIGWVAMAAFIAIALGGPVNRLSRRIPRGIAITLVYLVLVLMPVALGALVIPPLVTQGTELVDDVPQYARDITAFVEDNQRLRELDQKYDITGELEKQAATLPGRIGDAAKILGDVGLGVVNSIFALLNILILSVFMVSRGRGWLDRALRLRPEVERERLSRVIDRTGRAVSGYVQGALTVALIAGVQTYLVLMILGVPFRAPLAVMAALFSLVPLVGATIAAVLIGIVTLFTHFPTATIVWAIWAVVYQQLENNLIQPQIQKRTVQVQPFIVLVAVLFGSTLLGVVGALVAIPLAATIQIALREWWDYRREQRELLIVSPGELPPPDDDGPTLVVPST